MMKRILLLLTVLSVDEAHAAFQDGYTLHKLCQSVETVNEMFCIGYIEGIVDMGGMGGKDSPSICVPEKVSGGQVVDIVKKWFVDHPEHRHYAAAGLVDEALSAAFPCNK
jgi:hypothetical protein